MYLAASAVVLSATMIRVDKDNKQRSVSFMSKMLTDAEIRCTDFERIALALRMVAKKLRPYSKLKLLSSSAAIRSEPYSTSQMLRDGS